MNMRTINSGPEAQHDEDSGKCDLQDPCCCVVFSARSYCPLAAGEWLGAPPPLGTYAWANLGLLQELKLFGTVELLLGRPATYACTCRTKLGLSRHVPCPCEAKPEVVS